MLAPFAIAACMSEADSCFVASTLIATPRGLFASAFVQAVPNTAACKATDTLDFAIDVDAGNAR